MLLFRTYQLNTGGYSIYDDEFGLSESKMKRLIAIRKIRTNKSLQTSNFWKIRASIIFIRICAAASTNIILISIRWAFVLTVCYHPIN
jgi:hypothetical protein